MHEIPEVPEDVKEIILNDLRRQIMDFKDFSEFLEFEIETRENELYQNSKKRYMYLPKTIKRFYMKLGYVKGMKYLLQKYEEFEKKNKRRNIK